MRAPTAAILLALVAFPAAGCGRSQVEQPTPVACLDGPSAYANALAAAPGKVRLSDDTPISDCLTESQDSGELAGVGEALVETATKLNAEARTEPGGNASLQLGYLLGAVQRGTGDTEGIHADLVRRLAVAARYAPGRDPLPPAFYRAYKSGYAAGQKTG
jgi:hypothetical protein